MREVDEKKAAASLRVAHLLRVSSYLEIAIILMWTNGPRTLVIMGMVEASLRSESPGGRDDDLLERLRELLVEARDYYAGGDFPAAMARMRVAQDLVDLRIVAINEG